MTIGQRIKQLRQRRDISLSELASRAKVNKSVLSRLENDLHKTGLNVDTLRALADALEIPHGELLDYGESALPSTIIEASMAAEQAVNAQEYVARLVDLHEAVKAITHGSKPAREMKRED